MDNDLPSLDGVDLDAALGSDFAPAQQTATERSFGGGPAEPATEPTGESVSSVSSQPDQQQQQQAQQQQWNPDGPGDLRVALQQERQQRQQLAAQLEFIRQQQQAAQQQPEPEPQIDPLDPEAFSWQQRQVEALRAEVRQELQQTKLKQADELARMTWKDYDQTVATLGNFRGLINLEAIAAMPNPAAAAYQIGKMLQGADPNYVEAQVQERLSQILPNIQSPQAPQAPRTIGNLPAAAPNTDRIDDPTNISQAQLAAMSPADRESWYARALAATSGF